MLDENKQMAIKNVALATNWNKVLKVLKLNK